MSKNILVAEDERIISLDLKMFLQKNNFIVCSVVSTCEDLIDQYRSKNPDLIIIDFNLKGKISCKDAIIEIRKMDSTPIIIISGSSISKMIKFTATISHCKHLEKPFDQIELLEELNLLLMLKQK